MKKARFNTDNDYFTFMVRKIPADVYSKLKYIAILKKTSMNNIINDILLEFVNDLNVRKS
jgi:hypothetical protein